MATGLLAGANALRRHRRQPPLALPRETAVGSLCHYLTGAEAEEFAPVRFTFDLLPRQALPGGERKISRDDRRAGQCSRAVASLRGVLQEPCSAAV